MKTTVGLPDFSGYSGGMNVTCSNMPLEMVAGGHWD